jgi:CubicO group peptidase (beta-lactamase class C family)
MTSSDFYDRREAATDVAEGWDPVVDANANRTGWKQNIFSYPSIGSASDGAHVTAADLVRFLQAVRAGELLSPERTGLFFTPQVRHDNDEWYGFGLEITVDPGGTVWAYSKGGGNPGVSNTVRHYPGAGLDVVMLSNAERGGLAVVREIDRLIRYDQDR